MTLNNRGNINCYYTLEHYGRNRATGAIVTANCLSVSNARRNVKGDSHRLVLHDISVTLQLSRMLTFLFTSGFLQVLRSIFKIYGSSCYRNMVYIRS